MVLASHFVSFLGLAILTTCYRKVNDKAVELGVSSGGFTDVENLTALHSRSATEVESSLKQVDQETTSQTMTEEAQMEDEQEHSFEDEGQDEVQEEEEDEQVESAEKSEEEEENKGTGTMLAPTDCGTNTELASEIDVLEREIKTKIKTVMNKKFMHKEEKRCLSRKAEANKICGGVFARDCKDEGTFTIHRSSNAKVFEKLPETYTCKKMFECFNGRQKVEKYGPTSENICIAGGYKPEAMRTCVAVSGESCGTTKLEELAEEIKTLQRQLRTSIQTTLKSKKKRCKKDFDRSLTKQEKNLFKEMKGLADETCGKVLAKFCDTTKGLPDTYTCKRMFMCIEGKRVKDGPTSKQACQAQGYKARQIKKCVAVKVE